MEKKKCIAAYDFGTSGVKVALVSDNGDILGVCEKSYPLLKPQPMYVEQDPNDFWNAVCHVTKQVLAQSETEPSAVKALSFSVQAVTIIPVDKDGNTLCNAISWLDGRAEKQAEQINERCGAEFVRPQDHQSRLLWLKQNEPELYEKTEYFLECDGYLQYKATGIMNVSDDHPGIIKYHPAIQEFFDITFADVDDGKLPHMVEACSEYGKLDAKGAEELGLVEGTPVFGGMIDVPAAAAGCGCIKAQDAHIYLGSSGWLSAIIDRPYETADGAYQLNSILPDLMIYGGCTNCCCTMLNWAIDHFYAKEHEEMGGAIYDYVNKEVEKLAPGMDGLYATPWLFGEQFPISNPFIRANFFNISDEHTRAHFIGAVMESICFSMKGQIELYTKDTGYAIEKVAANGGGSLSDVWMQMMADVLQMEVTIPSETRHSGAIGAAVAAAIGLGWCDADTIYQFVKTEKVFKPNKDLKELYDKKYENYQKLYQSIKDLSREING